MSDEKREKIMLSRQKNEYSSLLHMAPTAIFHFFEKSSGRFFEVGHFCNFINVQNLRTTSEILGKRGGRPYMFITCEIFKETLPIMLLLRFIIVVIIEYAITFVDVVDWRRWRWFSEMRAVEVNNGVQIGDLDRKLSLIHISEPTRQP
jgi:hypothetical protein